MPRTNSRTASTSMLRAGRDDDRRDDLLAGVVARQADDRGVLDLRMLAQRVLDLGGGDVEAARDDELLDAVDDADEPGLVDGDDVAGAEPAVDDDRLGLLRLAVVPLNTCGPRTMSSPRSPARTSVVGSSGSTTRHSVPGSGSPTVPGTRLSATGFAISTGEHSLRP